MSRVDMVDALERAKEDLEAAQDEVLAKAAGLAAAQEAMEVSKERMLASEGALRLFDSRMQAGLGRAISWLSPAAINPGQDEPEESVEEAAEDAAPVEGGASEDEDAPPRRPEVRGFRAFLPWR